MSTPLPSFAPSAAFDDAPGPNLVQPETRRLDGAVREAYVPSFAPPVTHGSLADLPFDNAAAAPDAVVLSRRGADGQWWDVTAAEFADQVQAVAKGLIAEGLTPGDRIAIMARTTYEWTLLDFGAWAAGLVTVPVYPTSSVFQTRWILQDSGAVALVTETAAQAAALGPELDRVPDLRHLWVMEKGHVERLAEYGAQQPDGEASVRRGMLVPDTLATLIYTSGTTGRPKGCALTHGNFFAEVDNAIELLYPIFKARTSEEASVLLFLPMSHVFGRMVAVACIRARVRLGHAPSLKAEDLLPDLAAFRPTCLLTIPYMLEKVFNSARAKAESGGRVSSFDRAASVAERYGEALEARAAGTGGGPGTALKTARAFYDPLVYRRIRNAMGGRVQVRDLRRLPARPPPGRLLHRRGHRDLRGLRSDGDNRRRDGHPAPEAPPGNGGLARCPAPASVSRPTARSSSPATRCCAATGTRPRAAWSRRPRDGWLPTGDIGALDDEGYLTITGRKKELLITAGGKSVAPAPLENWLRSHPLISQCMVLGDRRPYVSALITLDMDGVSHWRRMNGKHPVPAELLVDDDELRAILQRAIDEANKLVSRPESIRRFAILPTDFTEMGGHLTPSMKLRREAVMRDFAGEVEGLYEK